ncbi:MAG: hypothetical protein EOP54_22220, partial [Sphingobacteriales bacterium]
MKNKILILKCLFTFILILPMLFSAQEGTKQVSPTAATLSGLFYNPTSNYGSYLSGPDDNNIKFVISDFNSERFYFGFSWTTYSNTAGATTILNYLTQTAFFYYRILDSTGNVVAGPTLLAQAAGSPGQIGSYAQAVAGPRIGTLNPTGYIPIQFTPAKNDTYIIQYWRGTSATSSVINNTAALSPLFDFTVAAPSPVTTPTSYTFKTGRIFATKWGLVTTTANATSQYFTDIASVGSPSFYVYTDANNVLKLDLPNIQPLAYTVGVNNYGIT